MLVLDAAGGRLVGEGRGPALGMTTEAVYGEARLRLQGDDRLVAFSDGLVEVREADLHDSLERLVALAAAAPREAEALRDRVLSEVAPSDADDVRVLALGPRTPVGS